MEAPAIHPAGGIADIQQNEVTSTRNQKRPNHLLAEDRDGKKK
jgi:hypothetical protein